MIAEGKPTTPPPNIEALPAELRQHPAWVTWCWERRGNKWDKPLYQKEGRTGLHAKTNDPATHCGLSDAYSAVVDHEPRWADGIGIVLNRGLVGIDLDHVRDPITGVFTAAWAKRVIEQAQIAHAYVEVSPSGDGFHIIGRGRMGKDVRKRVKLQDGTMLEVYDENSPHYFTVTGNLYGHRVGELVDLTPLLRELRDTYLGPNSNGHVRTNRPQLEVVSREGDEAIIARLRQQHGDSFAALYDRGDLTQHGNDHSAADLALCNYLANAGLTEPQIDRLFRASALMREKWDEQRGQQTYGMLTIAEARMTVRQARGMETATDVANALRFVEQHGGAIRYCAPWHAWLVYDGTRWAKDRRNTLKGLAVRTAREIRRDILRAAAGDEKDKTGLRSWARATEMRGHIEAMIDLASGDPRLTVIPEELDLSPWLLNTPTGTYDVEHGQLRAHDPADMLTKLTGASFDPEATCPTWLRFLVEVFDGDDDLIEWLQSFLGSCLTGIVNDRVFVVFHGEGANGKTTLLRVLLNVLGDYAIRGDNEIIQVQKHDRHPAGRADLQGARLAFFAELEAGQPYAESFIKSFTGGDRQKARFMRQNFFEYDPQAKLVILTNHMIPVGYGGGSEALWDRVRLIPFRRRFTPQEQDRFLVDKLAAERDGILTWLVEGAHRWRIGEGLEPTPVAVVEATAGYRNYVSPTLDTWLDTRCEFGDRRWFATADELYQAYTAWCALQGVDHPESQHKMGRSLNSRGTLREQYGPERRTRYRRVRLRVDET